MDKSHFPYCPQCGSVKPPEIVSDVCIPCANTGHLYRLVTDPQDAQTRLTRWLAFYKQWGFTKKQIESIPWYRNLKKGLSYD